MSYLPPFALFGSRTAVDEGRIERHIANWVKLLRAVRDNRIDIESAQRLPLLNGAVDSTSMEA